MDSNSKSHRALRLNSIAREAGVVLDTTQTILTPQQTPSFKGPDDETRADAVLIQLKIEGSSGKSQSKGLRRFSARGSRAVFTYDDLYAALTRVVSDNGLAGVVEVLLGRFSVVDGNINLARRTSVGMIQRIRNTESSEQRGRLIHVATGIGRDDLVQLLAPLADQSSLDQALHIAIEQKNLPCMETLLRHGANSALFEDTFIDSAKHGDAKLLSLFLRARLRVSDECITRSLLPATMSGSLDSVLLLVRAGAKSDPDCKAFMHAIEMDRLDLTAAIVSSPNPPPGISLNAALESIFSTTTSPASRIPMVEVLLCGGPTGNAANEGLFKAILLANFDLIQLLLSHKVDINYDGAAAVGHAIQRNRGDIVGLLLQDQSLTPENASDLVRHIPRTSQPSDKSTILSKLLVNGATGTYCNELLVTVAEQNDLETAQLLVSYGRDQNTPVCSVDYNAARCLQVAVGRNHVEMVKLLALEGGPTKFSLATAFSSIPPNLSKNDHFLIVQTLLRGGAQGPEVNDALNAAVSGHHKSPRLVELLVQFGAVVTDETLFACVLHGAVEILEILTTGNVTPQCCAEAITIAVKVHSGGVRFRIVKLLIGPATSAGLDVPQIAGAVIEILQNCPEDAKLLTLLCRDGKSNVNHNNGLAVVLATKQTDPVILDIVLRSEGSAPFSATIEQGLQCAIDLPLTDLSRRVKVEALLRRIKPQDAMNQALIKEIESAKITKDLSVIAILLAAGADINSYNAKALSLAVGDAAIMDLILSKRPSQKGLSTAFSTAMNLQDPVRHIMCEKLLKAGAAGEVISSGLCAIAREGPAALPMMKLLLPHADVNFKDGRVFRLVVQKVFSDALDLLLCSQLTLPSPATKAVALQEALKLQNQDDRLKITQRLLKLAISGPVISDALIAAVNIGDFELVDLLLQSGASVEHRNGAAIHSSASSGHHAILKLLVDKKPTLSTLTSGFGGASAIKSQPDTYFLVLDTLLKAGMRGEAIDAALVDAVKGGDRNQRIAGLLFASGASLEWQDGEALTIATQAGSIKTLKMLLERSVPQNILARSWRTALKLPRDQRWKIMEMLLQAGKAIDGHVSKTLTAATKESPSDRKLIKLLLDAGAFDRGESMVSAARSLDLRTLTLLANSPKAPDFISTAFKNATSTGLLWQSATGLAIVELMLKKGASGDAVGEALYQAVERSASGADILAGDFLEVLLRYGADANYQRGLVLQRATLQVDIELIGKLLPSANVESKAMSMPYLFSSGANKVNVQRALEAFSDSLSGEARDEVVLFKHPDVELEPILFQALAIFPRDTTILRTLLDIGYNPNQWQICGDEESSEPWPILCWALDQPEKKISSAVIEIMIDEGANINFRSKSGITPLTLAIRNQRADIVLKLLTKGAKATEPDAEGITPLNLAGSLTNTDIMGYILQAGAETDDGSLHDVARQLRCDAMRALIQNGHEVDYPSDRHEGRSALAELCLRAMDNSPSSAKLEDAIQCLIVNDANIREVSYCGKTIFHYALDSSDPVTILAVLLKMMWKFVNEDVFLFTDSKYTYSLTKYVEKGLFGGPQHQKQELLQILRNKRAKDRFWANSIDDLQPDDYCNGPPHIEAEVLLRKSRLKRQAEQREDVQRLLELKRVAVIGEVEIMNLMTEAEIGRERQKGLVERELLTEKANTQMQLDITADVQRDKMLKQKYLREEGHKRQLRDIQVSTQRAITAEESEKERARSVMQIEFMEKRTQIENAAMRERAEIENNGTRTRLAIEGGAFQEHERVMVKQHERELARIKMQKQLVAGQTTLAGTFQGTGLNQRQIGFITEA
ncbi:hypothetical protein BKA65DRAFT_398151 [Rhexocercosporidium sp. MPI-PUGE-AT-0058]|nr:hypothetical protein BKA65DRAFT_398151 [Rhexocercosporidium sp. MPI-PUGE-AT-0058]